MGNTFGSVLIPKQGSMEEIARNVRKAVEAIGEDVDEVDLELRAGVRDRFCVLTGELTDAAEWDAARALAAAYARRSGGAAISVYGFDSDIVLFDLTDGTRESALVFGEADALFGADGGVPPYIEEMWRPLFETKAAWRALCAALRGMQEMEESGDPFFAEHAARSLAVALKFDCMAACGFPEESEAEVVWSSGGAADGGMVPDGRKPHFKRECHSPGNPCRVGVYSAGGRGRGIDALILAYGFDPLICEIPDAKLTGLWNSGLERFDLTAPAHRVETLEGDGWSISFPDAEIQPGARGSERHAFISPIYSLHFSLLNADAVPRTAFDPAHPRRAAHLEVWMAPAENPDGGLWTEIELET